MQYYQLYSNKMALVKKKKLFSSFILVAAILALSALLVSCGGGGGGAETDGGVDPGADKILTVGPGGEFSSIQAAIDYAKDGYTISILPGTYNESIIINKRVSIIGAGASTIITGGSSTKSEPSAFMESFEKAVTSPGIIQIAVSGASSDAPLLIKGISVSVSGKPGITVSGDLSFIKLDTVHVTGSGGTVSDDQYGLYVDDNSSLGNLIISNSTFNNLDYGILAKNLKEATFDNTDADNNDKSGIDVTLVSGDVTFKNCDVTNTSGAGLLIAALEGIITIDGGSLDGNQQDIVIGDAGAGKPDEVKILNANILSVDGIVNNSSAPVVADNNFWGENEDPQDHVSGTGVAVTVEVWYDTENKTEDTKIDHIVKPGESTIQLAINEASEGDVIKLVAGTFVGNLNLNRKKITIMGSGVDVTIIDTSSLTGYAFHEFGNGSTIKDLTLIGTKEGNSSFGFKISEASNITLENIKVRDSYKTGIDLNGVNGAKLVGIEVNGTKNGFGINIVDSNDITLKNIKTSGNLWGGVSVQTSGRYYTGGSDNVKFEGTFDATENYPFLVEQDKNSNTYYPIRNLQIPAKFRYVVYGFREKSRSNIAKPWSTDNYRQWYYQETKTKADACAAFLPSSPDLMVYNSLNTYDVVDGINDYASLSIQSAINDAAAGTIINVASGTYDESITINKRVSIIGAGDTTIITKSVNPVTDGVIQLEESGISETNPILFKNLWIKVNKMAGFSVGAYSGATGHCISYVKLDKVKVTGTNDAVGESERGLSVDLTSSLHYLAVKDSHFDKLTYGWYLFKAVSNDTSTVDHVTVVNTTFNDNNIKGIYAEKLSDAVFTDCEVDNNGFTKIDVPSYRLTWLSGIDINLKAGNYSKIYFINCTVTNNGHGFGVGVDSNIGYSKEGFGLAIKARGHGGKNGDTGESGIPAIKYADFPATLSDVMIDGGVFTDNERGIRIGEAGKTGAGPNDMTVINASIYNNIQKYTGSDGSPYGDLINLTADPATAITVNAKNNWWGHSSGPSDEQISGSVDYSLPLAAPAQ